VTPTGIEPVTFWLVVLCLKHMHHHMPPNQFVIWKCVEGIRTYLP